MFETFGLLFGGAPIDDSGLNPSYLAEISPPAFVSELSPAPVIRASSAIIIDADSGQVVFGWNEHEPRAVASLNKLMTALVASQKYEPSELVSISRKSAIQPPAEIGLQVGEQARAEDLIAASLVRSANDAALALAEHAPGGEAEFVGWMQARAESLGLTRTQFRNPTGLDETGAHSTAFDISRVALAVLRDEKLAGFARQSRVEFETAAGRRVSGETTNLLFGSYLDIRGLKTGTTDAAGECVAELAVLPNGRRILAIVLDSPDRWQEAKVLLDWASRNVD